MIIKHAWNFVARRFRNEKCPVGICRELDAIFIKNDITKEQYNIMLFDIEQYVFRYAKFHSIEPGQLLFPTKVVSIGDTTYNSAYSRMRATICTYFANGKLPPLTFTGEHFSLTTQNFGGNTIQRGSLL